jgi:uncharacterized metal-binding protein YceD (DUF177 family)
MVLSMKILREDIPPEGLHLELSDDKACPQDLAEPGLVTDIIEPIKGVVNLAAHGDKISVKGTVTARLLAPCSRCLQIISLDLSGEFKVKFQVQPRNHTAEEEIMLCAHDLDVYFYDGAELDLTWVLRNELSLLLPMAPVCAFDCARSCPRCGKLMTSAECDCGRPDARWSKLAGIKENLNL